MSLTLLFSAILNRRWKNDTLNRKHGKQPHGKECVNLALFLILSRRARYVSQRIFQMHIPHLQSLSSLFGFLRKTAKIQKEKLPKEQWFQYIIIYSNFPVEKPAWTLMALSFTGQKLGENLPSQILFPKCWNPWFSRLLAIFPIFKKAVDLHLFFMPSTSMVTGLVAIFYVGSLSHL